FSSPQLLCHSTAVDPVAFYRFSLIRIPEGESIILGGFVNDDEARLLTGMPMLKDNPLLHYLFSEKRWQPDEPEIVLMLNPNIEGLLPNLSLDVPSSRTGR